MFCGFFLFVFACLCLFSITIFGIVQIAVNHQKTKNHLIILENDIQCVNRNRFEKTVMNLKLLETQRFGKVVSPILNNKLFFQDFQQKDVCYPQWIFDEVDELKKQTITIKRKFTDDEIIESIVDYILLNSILDELMKNESVTMNETKFDVYEHELNNSVVDGESKPVAEHVDEPIVIEL